MTKYLDRWWQALRLQRVSRRLQIASHRRAFENVVADIKHVVFSVLRFRPTEVKSQFNINVLGSGFFVSPTRFLTCHHVVNPNRAPHVDGDHYRLVQKTDTGFTYHHIRNVRVGQGLFFEAGLDIALLDCPGIQPQKYVTFDWGDIKEGKEIGVLGYPLGQVSAVGGQINYAALIPRVTKGTVTSQFVTTLTTDEGVLPNVDIIEVSFLFVPGNSGGPVFDSTTGKVVGFVNSFNAVKINEQIETAGENLELPNGVARQYIDSVRALYSYAIRANQVRKFLSEQGVT